MDKTRGMTCRIMNDVTGMECRANGRRKSGIHAERDAAKIGG